MTYVIKCRYRPGGAAERVPIRIRHLEYMIAALPITVFGGAIVSEDGQAAEGMLVVLNVATRADAERFVAAEPYSQARLFASIEIEPVLQMTPPDDGGPLYRELEWERRRRLP